MIAECLWPIVFARAGERFVTEVWINKIDAVGEGKIFKRFGIGERKSVAATTGGFAKHSVATELVSDAAKLSEIQQTHTVSHAVGWCELKTE